MAMKTIHNFVMLRLIFCHHDRLGETVELQRLAEQPFFRGATLLGL
jgi:hypothetical protein